LVIKGGDKSIDVYRRKATVVIDAKASLALVSVAAALEGAIGIVAIEADLVLFDVVEGVGHQTTVAAVVSELSRAVNKLHFGEDLSLSVFDGVGRLKRSDGREGPARTAGALVLDGSDLALISPVLGTASGGTLQVASANELVVEDVLGDIFAGELFKGQISEGVLTKSEGQALGVLLLDKLLVIKVDGIAVLELGLRAVGLSEALGKLQERVEVLLLGSGGRTLEHVESQSGGCDCQGGKQYFFESHL